MAVRAGGWAGSTSELMPVLGQSGRRMWITLAVQRSYQHPRQAHSPTSWRSTSRSASRSLRVAISCLRLSREGATS